MNVKERRYSPGIYGPVKAEYLNRLSGYFKHNEYLNYEEKLRQELIQDIKNGKLVIQKSR